MKEGNKNDELLNYLDRLFSLFTLLIVMKFNTINDHLWSLCISAVMIYYSCLAFSITLPISLHFEEPFKWSFIFNIPHCWKAKLEL